MTLEIAVHTGTGVALIWILRRDAARALRALDARRLVFHAAALGVPAIVGAAFERRIEERLGSARALRAGLVLGSVALIGAELAGERRPGGRSRDTAGPADGLALGIAQ